MYHIVRLYFTSDKILCQDKPVQNRTQILSKDREHDEYARQKRRDQRDNGDLGVDRRSGGIFERVADGVADDGGLMGLAALAALFARFDVLFRVVPQPAGVAHEERKEEPRDDVPEQKTADGERPADDADDDGGNDAHQPRRWRCRCTCRSRA